MRLLQKMLHGLYIIYAYSMFVIGLLIIFPFVIIAVFLGQPTGGNFVIHLCRGWSDCWLFMVGIINKRIIKEPIDPSKHYVFVSNHISYLDIPVIFQGIRKNNFRVLGKTEMSKIPLFGTVYKLAVVLVDRSSSEGRAKSLKTLRKVLGQNISILIYPEGTFNESGEPLKSFYDGAFRMAIETQTPIKPIVYPDTLHLMHHHSPFSLRPGISKAIILPAIPVEGLTLQDMPALKKMVYEQMEKCIIEYRD